MSKRKKKNQIKKNIPEENQVAKEEKSPSIILFHYGDTTGKKPCQ